MKNEYTPQTKSEIVPTIPSFPQSDHWDDALRAVHRE